MVRAVQKCSKLLQIICKGYGFQLTCGLENEVVPSIVNLLHSFEDKLPLHIFWYGGARASLFIINEAHELRALTKDVYGNEALYNLFKWLLLNTKKN